MSMNSLECVNEIFKPYKVTRIGKCIIIESTSGKFALKEKSEKNIRNLQTYLKSRGFFHYANLIDQNIDDYFIYEYFEDYNYPPNQKAVDMMKVVARLHEKTVFNKSVTEDKFKAIYDNVQANIDYLKAKFHDMTENIENKRFMSPSEYLFIRNYSKFSNQLNFCDDKLKSWYDEVKNLNSMRVTIVHNNLSLDHYIKSEKDYLISWDNYITDTPVLDIYNFYKKCALEIDFSNVLAAYLKIFPLNKEELDLLFILICLPMDINFTNSELKSVQSVNNSLCYTLASEILARPYYTKDNEE